MRARRTRAAQNAEHVVLRWREIERPEHLKDRAVEHVGRPENAEERFFLGALERLALSQFVLELSSHHEKQYLL